MAVKKVTMLSSKQVTSSENTSWFEFDNYDELLIFLRVTAQGTYTNETLDVKVQTKDPDDNAVDLSGATFTQVGDQTGSLPYADYLAVVVFGARVRLAITVAGSAPTYTMQIQAYAKGVR